MRFLLPDDGFSLKPKHVVRNKIDVNLVVADGLYFPFTIHVSKWDIIAKQTLTT
jgi:hypothetical protein